MDANEAANLGALERMADGFNRKDLDQILDNFTEDAVFETSQGPHPWGERFTGQDAIRRSITGIWQLLPDLAFRDATRFVCGDRGVSEWTCTATTPKGHPMEVRGCDLFQFRDGKVARKDTYFKQVFRNQS